MNSKVKISGITKWFNAEKGYGFITDEYGEDIFVHYTSIKTNGFQTLDEGENVSFEVDDTGRFLMAKNVIREMDLK